jgi:hypothetical protein
MTTSCRALTASRKRRVCLSVPVKLTRSRRRLGANDTARLVGA